MLSLAFLAIASIGGWPNGGQAKAIGAIVAPRQAFGPNISLDSQKHGRLKPRGLTSRLAPRRSPGTGDLSLS